MPAPPGTILGQVSDIPLTPFPLELSGETWAGSAYAGLFVSGQFTKYAAI